MESSIEKRIVKLITKQRTPLKSFEDIISGFETKFNDLNLSAMSFQIDRYFSKGMGQVTATNELLNDGRIKEDWLREYETKQGNTKTDFKGLYVFLNGDTPFYVGISKGVIGRIIQHVKGHNHNTSTLAYKIGLLRYKLVEGEDFVGGRKDLDFKSEVEPVKEFLSKQKVAWIQIDNDEEMFLFEVYCSMKLGTVLNDFETH